MPQYQGMPAPVDDFMKETIILAACEANEILPQTDTLPADIFTACLTTPIKVSLRPVFQGWLMTVKPFSWDLLLMAEQ